ncbi:uncharacterized protein BX664DRAFT_326048 [Halteromyces radiatus]|uniref:uncharacterized protein n=1 Tax=Halteromyces radiatus TaxID=101107 RepID=UPI00221F3C66|nr:uncharacterized protein BX664DRAFT_326048 [Halteromyces radiatus]KAI8097294.1 hypothetical protein BX664DRAFT_326048 [Halteromyces radiatus]
MPKLKSKKKHCQHYSSPYDTNNIPHYISNHAYANYINQGMYCKQHAEKLAQKEERAKRRKDMQEAWEKRKEEMEESSRKLEASMRKLNESMRKLEESMKKLEESIKKLKQVLEKFLEQLKRHKRIRPELTPQKLRKYRKQYILQWDTFIQQLNNNNTMTDLRDIPWPTLGSPITRDNVRIFLIHHTPKQIRQEILRYHPDKFIPRIKSIFKGSKKDLDWIQKKDNEVSCWLNELWTERNGSRPTFGGC